MPSNKTHSIAHSIANSMAPMAANPTATTPLSRRSLLGLAGTAALGMAGGSALLMPGLAHAEGRLMDVQVLDRDSGRILPVYEHRGDLWVAGHPGANYAVMLRNQVGERLMAVVSVDGVNVVSGETASFDQTGYVISPYQRYDVNGWRKSDREVAAFNFTKLRDSYAARTGRPFDVGVIGVAIFRERPYIRRHEEEPRGRDYSSRDRRVSPQEADRNTAEGRAYGKMAPEMQAAPAPRLGTGHGEREDSWVGHTNFERRSSSPDEIISIRYDSRANLVARGIIPRHRHPYNRRPDAFPGETQPGYVPDPR